MNYHSDKWIKEKLTEHYNEALEHFQSDHIVGIFVQGSQNYQLDYENSDLDTKLIVVPDFKDIVFNKKPVSTTHVRDNDEHIDFKDIRLYMQTFRKQNLNFLEILFTKYCFINPKYIDLWSQLTLHREEIARYSLPQAIKSMKGIAMEKYHAMEHEYSSKIDIIQKYGYDPKQLHHLLRVEEYLQRYIDGEDYADCLIPRDCDYLKQIKTQPLDLEVARQMAQKSIEHINEMCDVYLRICNPDVNKDVDILLDDIQYKIMRRAIGIDFDKE